jgi:hypothetical protein
MEDVDIFYGHLVHFTVFCCILWTFGIVRGNLVYFPRFGILYQEKSGNSVCDCRFLTTSVTRRLAKNNFDHDFAQLRLKPPKMELRLKKEFSPTELLIKI